MKYDIQSRSDFLTGSYLVVKIPENELDQCALYTIQKDCPDFIIPFHYKTADGQIEFTYKIGTLCKLHYFSGDLSPSEYADLWQSLLKPLLDCADWFMNPCSFLLNTDCLYYDKNKKAVRYVYVPTAYGCSGYDAFYEMAIEISKMMTVSDAVLENKVLRAILKDFNPVEFLQMLKDHISGNSPDTGEDLVSIYHNDTDSFDEITEGSNITELPKEPEIAENTSLQEMVVLNTFSTAANNIMDDFVIDITPDSFARNNKERGSSGYRIFSRRSKRKKIQSPVAAVKSSRKSLPERSAARAEFDDLFMSPVLNADNHLEIIDITQNTPIVSDGPGLKYIGCSQLPPAIQIMISEGEIFTIGRFDATVGKKQSNFEFDKKTKAVSRRHAVIERDINGYKIVDLSSSAGTFVNEKKLPPNTPYGLETGYRVSFGNSGADYVWEVS